MYISSKKISSFIEKNIKDDKLTLKYKQEQTGLDDMISLKIYKRGNDLLIGTSTMLLKDIIEEVGTTHKGKQPQHRLGQRQPFRDLFVEAVHGIAP